MNNRNTSIDILRGIAIIAMILIHTSYYFISNRYVWELWNWSQFAVPVFIFCSGYVFFMKDRLHSLKDYLLYLKKRLIRLIGPYYIFLPFFLLILWKVSPEKLTFQYVFQSIFLNGGIEINWLVLLILQLAIIFPIIAILRRKKMYFSLYLLSAIIFSISIIFFNFHISYKNVMWIPWSIIGIASMGILTDKKQIKPFIFISSFLAFIITYLLLTHTHHDVSLINNKYPPNFLLITYGIWTTLLLYWLAEKNIFKPFQPFLSFMSQHSYAIYFIHYSILIATVPFIGRYHLQWYIYFLFIFLSTITIKYLFLKVWQKK